MVYLWRAVNVEGEVLDVLVQTRRNKRAALKLMRKLLKKYGFVPDKLVTDDLRSYAAAAGQLGIAKRHERGQWRNNRAENSHQPTRRRERKMQGFKSPGSAQKFLSTHAAAYNTLYGIVSVKPFFFSGYDASDKPARLTYLDYRDERAILIKGRMVSAQVVWLGHGTLRRLLPSDDGTLSSPRPIVSSTSNAISPPQKRTEPSGPRRCRRGATSSLRREPNMPADLLRALFGDVTVPSRSFKNIRDAEFSCSSFNDVTTPGRALALHLERRT